MRIISLLPAATEIVCALGLQSRLVGVSHECDYPTSVSQLPKVTRSRLTTGLSSDQIDTQVREMVSDDQALYDLDEAALIELQPDVIVTQALCDVCAVSDRQVDRAIRDLTKPPRVLRLSPKCLADVFAGMAMVGQACEVTNTSELVQAFEQRVTEVAARGRSLAEESLQVLLLEWIDPLFSAGHWNPELIELVGCTPVLGAAGQPSRRLVWSDVLRTDPDAIIIACCGFTIDRAMEDIPTLVSYPGFAKLKCVQTGRVYLTNGSDYFNRPGPRLVESLELLAHTLHPEYFSLPEHIERAARIQRVTG